jgi:hypothetical protein
MRENYPKTLKPNPAQPINNDQQLQVEPSLPQEPDYINRLRNKLVGDQALTNTIKNRFTKRLQRYESVPLKTEGWTAKETNIKNLICKFTDHMSTGQSLKSTELQRALESSTKAEIRLTSESIDEPTIVKSIVKPAPTA